MRSSITILVFTLLTGCGVINEQSVYEGVRSQQKANNAGKAPKQSTLPSYDQYQKEREVLKK